MLLIIGEIHVRIEGEHRPNPTEAARNDKNRDPREVRPALLRIERAELERDLETRDPNLLGAT